VVISAGAATGGVGGRWDLMRWPRGNLAMKQEILANTTQPGGKSGRYWPG